MFFSPGANGSAWVDKVRAGVGWLERLGRAAQADTGTNCNIYPAHPTITKDDMMEGWAVLGGRLTTVGGKVGAIFR